MVLRAIPEERIWLERQQSPETRRAYRSDVLHFTHTMNASETSEFRKVDRMAVVACKRKMEADGAKPRTVRRPLAALSSLFSHLVDQHVVHANHVREIRRPRFSAHSMRATFISRALDSGASLEEVQRAAGHADATTTKLYDRRGYNPERSASFFATY